jgi:hypothetical protein
MAAAPVPSRQGDFMCDGKQGTMAAAFATSAAFSLLAGCAFTHSIDLALGTPADGHFYDRRVLIGVNTRSVNIDAGQVIKFIVQEPDGTDRSFTWRFNIVRETVVDLSTIAPAGVLDRPVKVVVGPNPLY